MQVEPYLFPTAAAKRSISTAARWGVTTLMRYTDSPEPIEPGMIS